MDIAHGWMKLTYNLIWPSVKFCFLWMDFFPFLNALKIIFLSQNSESQTEKWMEEMQKQCAAPNIGGLFVAAANLFVANPLLKVIKD